MGLQRALVSVAALLFLACADSTPVPPANEPTSPPPAVESPRDLWWKNLSMLCGQAYSGAMTSSDPVDADFADQAMVMYVARCEEERLEIPFHVGDNRSRTWVLTRTPNGIQLQHDHRHEDGSSDDVTLYGGHTATEGTAVTQDFPADDYSKELFQTHDLDASVVNVWTMEIVPGERFSYILRRPERHFQADFDLGQTVEPPPPAWGHE